MLFSCYKVARIIAFVQCLQADIAPFIIHAENKEEYEGRLDSPARLEQLFRVEQRRFYRETEPSIRDIAAGNPVAFLLRGNHKQGSSQIRIGF